MFADFFEHSILGRPKTDKSRRTLDFPPFVAALLAEHRSEVHELRRFAGERWQDHGLVFQALPARAPANVEAGIPSTPKHEGA
jgi:hypothetical protein